MSTIVIGDIHGESQALRDLLRQVVPVLRAADTLVFLGDYIDRGPDTRGVIDQLVQLRRRAAFRVVPLLGNHEQWLLRTIADPTHHSWLIGMESLETVASYSREAASALLRALEEAGPALFTSRRTLPYELFFQVMPRDHLEFLQDLEVNLRTPDVVCAHAGFALHGDPLGAAEQDVYVWGREGSPEGYRGSETVAYGHWDNALIDERGGVHPRVRSNRSFGLDTISHGVLTAVRFPDRDVWHGTTPKNIPP